MKLCAPVSHIFPEVRDVLLPIVDAVSFKRPSEESFAPKPQFLESSYHIADPELRTKLVESGLLAALHTGKYDAFACDIGHNRKISVANSPNGFPRAQPQSEPISDSEYLDRAVMNAEWLRAEFHGYIQLENLNYFPTGAYDRICEPDFIGEVCERADVGLLLDVGHAVVSAHYFGVDLLAYVQALPLGRVREIQLSHAGMLNGVFEDLHELPSI